MNIVVGEYKNKSEMYDALIENIKHIAKDTTDAISVLANASALIKLFLVDINWAGFYLMREGRLVLGPFQGKPAVTRIEVGQGVCGTAVETGETQLVEDVHACCNHIACDIASSSEIVVPMHKNGELIGVLDIDSPTKARFDDDDRKGLEAFVSELVKHFA